MKQRVFGRHRALMFRSYFFLVAGLLLAAVVLDLGFRYLQGGASKHEDPWLAGSLKLIESELAAATPAERASVLDRLRRDSGLDIRLLANEDVASEAGGADIETLVDADGRRSHIYRAPALDGQLYVRPPDATAEDWLPRLLTPLFYLSIFVVVGLWLRPLLKDLNHITAATQRFAADYREPLATATETTRLTDLARNLDDMSLRLSGLIQTQKELIAALSHEMRTPLARLRFGLAVIDRGDDAALRGQLDGLNGDIQEIDLLIGTMLNYARLDHPDLRMNWQRVPLADWLGEAAARWQQTGKEVSLTAGPTLAELRMDPHLMGLALSNLLSNAVRHAAGRVRGVVRSDDDGNAMIVVEDDGRGVPEAARESIFKAFTRLDDSRNRETGGSGLGLAIVARIAALHGGAIAVDASPELGGARFTLTWSGEWPAERAGTRS